jgi:hypothetical protein
MTIAEAQEGSASAVFELIASFSESADARLRGNAVQALAALIGAHDESLHRQAMNEMVRVMSAEPGGSGALDWQRRFVARCLDALGRLQPAERQLVGQQILATSFSARERERRAAIARLSLAAMEHDRRFWTAGWIRWMRLVRLAARPGFWITLWSVLWRTAVVWGIFASAAEFAPGLIRDETFSDDLYQHAFGIALLTAALIAISALLSVSGSIRPPLGISIADTTVSATTFVLLIIITAWTGLTPDLSVRDVLPLCVLGFVLGAALRALRWVAIAVATEPNGTAVGLRPLATFGVTTLFCIVAGRLGMDMRAAGMGWMVLAPATMIAAWLDVWLENGEPHPLSQGRARTDSRWAIPVLAGAAILLSGWLVHVNLKQALAMDNALQLAPLLDGGIQSTQVIEKVRLPASSDSNGPITVTVGFGRRIPVDADIEGSYQIVAETNPNERITLFLIEDALDKHGVTRSSGDKLHPPTITGRMEKDSKYFICVMPEVQPNCSLYTVASFRDFDMLVINGNIGRAIDIHATHTISISSAR